MNRPLQIDQLREKLLSEAKNDKRRVLVLHGDAAVGKTQLAIQFVRIHKDEFDSVFWVDGSTDESLKWDLAALQWHLKGPVFSAEAQSYTRSSTNLSCVMSEVLQWFSIKENNRWLLVVDNLMSEAHFSGDDNELFKLQPFLPTADQSCILITTRRAQSLENSFEMKLGLLDTDQARRLLVEHIGRQSPGKCDGEKSGYK